MYELSMILRPEGSKPRVETNGKKMESINKTNYTTSVNDDETQRLPISIVSFLRRGEVDFKIDNNEEGYDDHEGVHNFVVDVYTADTYILDDITYILSCAILIELNFHYQTVSVWTPRLRMLPNLDENSYPRKIDTAWKFDDFTDTGSSVIKKKYETDLNRRLITYHKNLDKIVNEEEAKHYEKYLETRKNYPKLAGGSKTKKQKKQRQRKQKSKRKKN